MARNLTTRIDPEVLKLRDQKTLMLRHGQLSAEGFALLVAPGDPYVLIGDTIYALTEQEFWALRAVLPVNVMNDRVFQYLLDCDAVQSMHEKDREFIARVKKDLPHCPACRYNRYKDEVYKLAKAYAMRIPQELMDVAPQADKAEYPETDGAVVSKVSGLVSHMYKLPMETRKQCLDCVEKHLAQAWVLAHEALQGYPEYASIVVGHLGEALDEMPAELIALRDTVEFCLAKTNHDGVPFVPLMCMAPMLTYGRAQLDLAVEDRQDVSDASSVFELELTDDMRAELSKLTEACAKEARRCVSTALNFTLEVENPESARIAWQGAMACLADTIVDQAPKTANMIRNRRLLFHVKPDLAAASGYSMSDVAAALG